MYYIVYFLISAGAIFFLANSGYIPGIQLDNGYMSALIFTVLLTIINLILGTILRIVTLPFQFLTLGLFSFVIGIALVGVTDQITPGVTLNGIVPHLAIALVTSIISFIMKWIK